MLRVAIVGSGFGLYGQLPAFNSITNCEIVAICGKKTERLINYCKSIGLKKIYTDWQEMLRREKLDVVAIAVNPSLQYEIAKKAIEKGINVFAEKPLAANVRQAKELLKLAKKNKIIHAIDFIFPEIDLWQKAKRLIDDKALGELKHISVNWDFLSFDIKNRIYSWKTVVKEGGGALSFYFSHTLYYLEYFVGEILDIKSIFSYSKDSINGGETGIDLLIRFKNEVKGCAHLHCDSQGLRRHQLVFECERGVIVLENENAVTEGFIIKIYDENGVKKLLSKNITMKKDEDERVIIVKRLAVKFVNACIYNKQLIPSFREGVRVQELMEKIRAEQI